MADDETIPKEIYMWSGFMAVSKRDSHKGVKIEEFNDILRKKSNISCSYLSVEIYNRYLLNFRSKKFLLQTKV